jgi:hypothetical protein
MENMHKDRVNLLVFMVIIGVLTATACGLPAAATPTAPPTLFPTDAIAAEPSPVLIEHLTQPSAGGTAVANAHDNEETLTFEEKSVRGGDEFRINRFERPFTAPDMVYLPQIDIVGMSMTKDDAWYYVQIKLAGVDAATSDLSGVYGVEFDLNIDGKTEVLVLAQGPLGANWTTDGVTVYADLNGDIGGLSSRPDDIYAGNGYETIVFDSGKGDDPDVAWARSSPDNAVVEIAIKQSVLRDYPKWMWNPLASAYPLDPSKFYFNDTFTEARAGSPNKGSEFYPLKELAGFDNTCRVPANFQATGSEPMGCQVKVEQKDLDFEGYPQ